MKIISRRQHHEEKYYQLCFDYVGESGAGYSFSCDEHGTVDAEKLAVEKPIAFDSYQQCLTGKINNHDLQAPYVSEHTNRWVEPAIGECNSCGNHVELRGFTNTCDCGADYNMSGQELAPRSQWGEETGELLADILSIK